MSWWGWIFVSLLFSAMSLRLFSELMDGDWVDCDELDTESDESIP